MLEAPAPLLRAVVNYNPTASNPSQITVIDLCSSPPLSVYTDELRKRPHAFKRNRILESIFSPGFKRISS